MHEIVTGSLGNFITSGTGTPVDVSQLSNVVVSWGGDWYGTLQVEVSFDGSTWAKPADMTASTNGDSYYALTIPAQQIRINMTSWGAGTFGSGTCRCTYSGTKEGRKLEFRDLGDLDADESTSAKTVSDLDELAVTVQCDDTGTFAYSGTVKIEVSQDGTRWAPAPGSSTFTAGGTLAISGRVKQIRATMSSWAVGTAHVVVAGKKQNRWDGADCSKPRFTTLGDFDAQETGSEYHIEDLRDVLVAYTFGAASATLKLECKVGTFWIQIPGTSDLTADGSVVIPFVCESIRARTSAYSSGTVYVRLGGADFTQG